eukprot:scaffold82880_cov44-Prasinocladus_malaysianus.AAC.1
MATVDSVDALSLLQATAPMSFDGSRLMSTACIGFQGVKSTFRCRCVMFCHGVHTHFWATLSNQI